MGPHRTGYVAAMRLFAIAAAICLFVALLVVIGALSSALGTGYLAWMVGGLLAIALDLVFGAVAVTRRSSPNP